MRSMVKPYNSNNHCKCVCSVTQIYQTLCDPLDHSPPGSSVHGVFQARILEWVTISFSRGSSQPRDWTLVSCVSYIDHLGSPWWIIQLSLTETLSVNSLGGFGFSMSNLFELSWHFSSSGERWRELSNLSHSPCLIYDNVNDRNSHISHQLLQDHL